MWLIALVTAMLVAAPFPIPPDPERAAPIAVYEGIDIEAGIVSTDDGVLAASRGAIFLIDKDGRLKKVLGSSVKLLARAEGGGGLALLASPGRVGISEVRRSGGEIRLTERCRLKGAGDPTRATKLVSNGIWGMEAGAGGLLIDAYTCEFKRFDGPFTLGLPQDAGSGIPFVHGDSAFIARSRGGEIDVAKIDMTGHVCGAPIAKSGYVAVPVEEGVALAPPVLRPIKTYAPNVCGRPGEILISAEQKSLYLPLANGLALYYLTSTRKKWDHLVHGSARLLGVFGQDLFWAYIFDRDGESYVNLFRFHRKSAQLFGRHPLRSRACGRFARTDAGRVALELDDRIVVYEGKEVEPRLWVPKEKRLVDIVAYGDAFFALDEGGRLFVVPAGKRGELR